jgi:hypothetical protein
MSQFIDLEDTAALEKLGQALLNIPTFVVSMTKRAMEIQESRDMILNTVFNSDKFVQNVDFALLDSSTKLLPRLKDVEVVTGLNALYLEDEEHEPTLPERIEALEQRTILAPEKLIDEPVLIPKTSLEQKAIKLIESLRTKPRSPTGIKSMDNTEIKEFINEDLPEDLRGKDKNIRRFKARIINKAKELYPNLIDVHKNKDGRHETTIFIKETFQSKGAVRAPHMLAGVMLYGKQ